MILTKKLEDTLGNFDGGIKNSDLSKSMAMAIEALGHQPCNDCISRQAAIDCLNADFTIDGKENMETVVDYINGAFEQIKALPSVKPTHKEWIPVSEGATNKDMFRAVFGYEPATDAVVCNKADLCGDSEPCNYCISNPDNIGRELNIWWNAPYKAESEDKG